MLSKHFNFVIFFFFINILTAQNINLEAFHWRNIGPANQGGRIIDIESLPNDFAKVWMATGSGGVWHSQNAGTTWKPIFDKYSTASIGDIAIDLQNPTHIWVGTGESNNRNSVSWGDGIFLSTDGGETFVNKGLNNTHHISRVVVDPKDSDKICVCATGHLWGTSGDRGIFISKNKGEDWKKMTKGLPDNDTTGCTDLVIDPSNPDIMYAAMYYRLRKPWTFVSGNENGGIFKTTNGGKSWKKLTGGLPEGPTGRIGLTIYAKNPKIVMALVEAEKTNDLAKPGSGVYRSEDGGETWKYMNTYNNRPFYYSQIRINPVNDQKVYLLTTSFMVSIDGGETFVNGSEDQEVHGDFHAMWVDPSNENRYYLGADKGMSITHDHGQHFQLFDNLPIGQFYRIGYDFSKPYRVFGGLQDNGFYGMSTFTRDIRGILNDSNWKLHWGDGQFTASDPDDPTSLFTSAENGSYFHYNTETYEIERISPSHQNILNLKEYYTEDQLKSGPLRYNWSAPLKMAHHESENLYVAGNHVFRSTNKGKSWSIISPDLTTNDAVKTKRGVSGGVTPDNTGAETHCAISSLSISPINEDIIWAGTDDSQVSFTKDGGLSWVNVRKNIEGVPEHIWVSRLESSNFFPGRAYVTFDGHRSDHFAPLILVTEDFGNTWVSLKNNLPETEVVRVIREDLINENLLFIGTETGVWISLDRGRIWTKLNNGFPTVSVYDLAIHPRDHDLIVGTHGRSIWILEDIYPLQQMNKINQENGVSLFDQSAQILWKNNSRGGQRGHFWFAGDNPAGIRPTTSLPRAGFDVDGFVTFYNPGGQTKVKLRISSNEHKLDTNLMAHPGINKFRWNRLFNISKYTDSEQNYLNQLFDDLLAQYSSNLLRRTATRFRNSTDVIAKRQIIQSLIDGFLKLPIDPSLGLPKAGPGEYKIEFIDDQGQTKSTTLVLLDDEFDD